MGNSRHVAVTALACVFAALGCSVGNASPADDTSGAGDDGAAWDGGGKADGSGGTSPATPSGEGTWENPLVIPSLPFIGEGDTSVAVSSEASAYTPCAPSTHEGGPEVVYRVVVSEPGWLWARIDDLPGDAVDLDVHLLRDATPEACVTRANVELGAPVAPGDWWVVVDSWTDGQGAPLSGPYTLEVGFVADGSYDCHSSPISCDGMLPPYVNGTPLEETGDVGCPPGMARIDGFCIDRYEAMLAELLPDGSLAPWSPYANPGGADVVALSVAGVVPQGFITQVQAERACLNAGKRLCDDGEWLRACEGAAGTTYPYGDSRQPGVCNDARSCHPVIQYFESDASWVWYELDHPCISQLPEGLAPTGSHVGCTTDAGVFDMMGNLHEWTSDPAGTFRGGFYVDTVVNGDGCHYATTRHDVQHWDYSTGFRCCADAS